VAAPAIACCGRTCCCLLWPRVLLPAVAAPAVAAPASACCGRACCCLLWPRLLLPAVAAPAIACCGRACYFMLWPRLLLSGDRGPARHQKCDRGFSFAQSGMLERPKVQQGSRFRTTGDTFFYPSSQKCDSGPTDCGDPSFIACCGRACCCLLWPRSCCLLLPRLPLPAVAVPAVVCCGRACCLLRPRLLFFERVPGRVPGYFPNQVCLLKNLADPPYITAQSFSDPATRIHASPAGGRAKPNRPVVHLHPHPGVRNPQPGRFIVKRPLSVIGLVKSARRAQGGRNP
jgi:hypothetical protein